MFDYDDGVAGVHQPMENREQFAYVVEVEPGRRLVQDVEGSAGAAFGQFAAELDALGLAAGERGRRLALSLTASSAAPEGT